MKKELFTDRLRLRMPNIKDIDVMFTLLSKEEVNIYNPAGPHKLKKETEEMLLDWIEKDWGDKKIGYYLLENRDTHRFIGYAGLSIRQFAKNDILNLAYRIEPEFQGKGYVKEACNAILSEGFTCDKNNIIMVKTKYNNMPSIGVAKSLGFLYDPKYDNLDDKGDVFLFLKRENFDQNQRIII